MSQPIHSHVRKMDHAGHVHAHGNRHSPVFSEWAARWLGAGAGWRLLVLLPAILLLWLAIYWALQ